MAHRAQGRTAPTIWMGSSRCWSWTTKTRPACTGGHEVEVSGSLSVERLGRRLFGRHRADVTRAKLRWMGEPSDRYDAAKVVYRQPLRRGIKRSKITSVHGFMTSQVGRGNGQGNSAIWS